MIEEMLTRFCKELAMTFPKKEKQNEYLLEVNETISLKVKDLDPGLYLHSVLTASIEKKKEELFMHLMSANLLGQGTENTVIGCDGSGKFLTLSLTMPYEIKYVEFKEAVEDFVNYLIYWRGEIEKFKEKAQATIL